MNGFYVSGMEIPTYGAIMVLIFPNGNIRGMKYGSDKWELSGQAIDLPPHGRCIDALWVREQIIKRWMDHSDDSYMYKRGMEDAYEIIRNAPTIVPAGSTEEVDNE